MATWDDVRRAALALPETSESTSYGGAAQWLVRTKSFVWERPLRRSDLDALGEAAPTGPILAAYVADVGVKASVIADDPEVYFTTPHFDGFRAILVRLELISTDELREVITDGWLTRAPKRLAKQFLDASG
jgi:hypothetical protein